MITQLCSLANAAGPPSEASQLAPARSSQQSLGQRYATDLKHSRQLADEAHRQNAKLLERADALMTRQEHNIQRYEAILATWEKQQAQYQKYLDSLPIK